MVWSREIRNPTLGVARVACGRSQVTGSASPCLTNGRRALKQGYEVFMGSAGDRAKTARLTRQNPA